MRRCIWLKLIGFWVVHHSLRSNGDRLIILEGIWPSLGLVPSRSLLCCDNNDTLARAPAFRTSFNANQRKNPGERRPRSGIPSSRNFAFANKYEVADQCKQGLQLHCIIAPPNLEPHKGLKQVLDSCRTESEAEARNEYAAKLSLVTARKNQPALGIVAKLLSVRTLKNRTLLCRIYDTEHQTRNTNCKTPPRCQQSH